MPDQNGPTRPDSTTRATEKEDAGVSAGSDKEPTSDEEEAAARAGKLDPEVSRSYEDAIERGAAQKGEGRVP